MTLTHAPSSLLWVHSSSKNTYESLSSQIGLKIQHALQDKYTNLKVVERDTNTVPHLDQHTIKTFGNTGDWLETLSSTIVEEVRNADILVVSFPIINFNIPSSLKAWIDHLVVKGQTFKNSPQGSTGLLHPKKLIINITSGGKYDARLYEHVIQYLGVIFSFIGIVQNQQVECLWTHDTVHRPSEECLEESQKSIEELIKKL